MPKYEALVTIIVEANNFTEAIDKVAYRRGVTDVVYVREKKNA